MRFWLGTHQPGWLSRAPYLFVSRRRLFERVTLPEAAGPWALDSGGFTELALNGGWVTTEDEYVADVLRFQEEIGKLEWVAPMDWMCEPFVLSKTGGSVEVHQQMTVENFLRLRDRLGDLVIPVLQGWTQDQYHICWGMYEDAGVDLADEPLVGVGSVCRRQDTEEANRIFRSLGELRLHGFGVKVAGLEMFRDVLASSDSMAWSYEARRRGRRFDRQAPLFEWPQVMLCGSVHPQQHRAKNCANCEAWALQWRDSVVKDRLEVAA
jgi:hypothetical protein